MHVCVPLPARVGDCAGAELLMPHLRWSSLCHSWCWGEACPWQRWWGGSVLICREEAILRADSCSSLTTASYSLLVPNFPSSAPFWAEFGSTGAQHIGTDFSSHTAPSSVSIRRAPPSWSSAAYAGQKSWGKDLGVWAGQHWPMV